MVGEMISSTASSFAAIAGGIGGALVLMGVIILVCFCMFHYKRYSNRNSDTASSDPSAAVEQKTGGPVSSLALARGVPEGARVFRMQELEQATKNFDESNLIGCGSFGLVFKGFLFDGTIVAIKTRLAPPRQQFSEEVARLSMTQHRNLVNLLGYCQESGYQMLVLEYLPNGTMCNHLYGMGRDSSTKLEFKQRLSIASGTAKGLWHLHGQCPPVVHGNFKTGNVLVDENFIAKVADGGVSRLLKEINHNDAAGPSHSIQASPFIDPEVYQTGVVSEASDIYGFGVFLWELITGREAAHIHGLGSNQTMLQWVEAHLSSDDLVDHRLMGKYSAEGMRDLMRLAMRCTSFPGKERPNMDMVAVEAERILEKEIMGTTAMGEASATLTLGSQLFTN